MAKHKALNYNLKIGGSSISTFRSVPFHSLHSLRSLHSIPLFPFRSIHFVSFHSLRSLHFNHSFIIPFLIVSSIFIDVALEYNINLNIGTLFYALDNGAVIAYLAIDEHFAIACLILPVVVASILIDRFTLSLPFHSFHSVPFWHIHFVSFSSPFRSSLPLHSTPFVTISNSTLSIPMYQDIFIFMSSCFTKGPINLLEVISCLNCCYNLHHIHYYNILFIIYFLLVFILVFHIIPLT
jgi:hypothetical protein